MNVALTDREAKFAAALKDPDKVEAMLIALIEASGGPCELLDALKEYADLLRKQ